MPSAESAVSSTDISRRLRAIGFPVTDEQAAALAEFVELLLRWNEVYNLTGVRGFQ